MRCWTRPTVPSSSVERCWPFWIVALRNWTGSRAGSSCAPITLSARECQIISLIADGLSYTRIADQLGLSAHTVTTHRRNLMQKLGVNSTAAVVMYAVKHGLTTPNKYLFNPPS